MTASRQLAKKAEMAVLAIAIACAVGSAIYADDLSTYRRRLAAMADPRCSQEDVACQGAKCIRRRLPKPTVA